MEDEEARSADRHAEIIPGRYFGPGAGAARTIDELGLLAAGKEVNEDALRTDTPLGQVKAFAMFVSTHSHILKSVPGEIVPLARNHAKGGFVADRATPLAESLRRPWIARDPRPPLRLPSRLLTISAECYSVAVAGDGRTALSSGPDGVWLWNTFSGWRLRSYPSTNARAIALSRDGGAALFLDGGLLQVWDTVSGSARALSGDSTGIRRAALSDNGLVAVSASSDLRISISDTLSGSCMQTVECDAQDIALSGDGRLVISACSDQTVRVWEVASGACLRTFHNDASCVAISADGKIALSGGTDLCVWDVESAGCLRRVKVAERIERLALTPDGRIALTVERGRRLFSGNRQWTIPNRVCIWDVASGEQLRALASSVVDAAMSEDGRTVVTASIEGSSVTSFGGQVPGALHVWNVVSAEDEELNKDEISMVDVVFAPHYKIALTASYNDLCVRDLLSEECEYLHGHTDNINFVAVSPNGTMALSGACDYSLRVWDVGTTACVRKFSCNTYVYGGVFASDGRQAVSASDEVGVWDIATGECTRSIRSPDELGDAISIALTPDDKTVLASYNAPEMRLWNLSNSLDSLERQTGLEYEEPIAERSEVFQGHEDIVKCVAVTGDGRRAVSASLDQTLRVWDLTTGECLHKLTGHSAFVRRVALTADGWTAVSASEDGSIRIWDIFSGSCIGVYQFGRKVISLSAVRPDGQFAVVSAGGDLQYLRLRCVPQKPPVVTAVRLFTFAPTKLSAPFEGSGARHEFGAYENADANLFSAGQLMEGEYERDITTSCLWCGQRLPAPASALDAIHDIAKRAGLAEDDSPCLKLPPDAWAEPRLLIECSHCGAPLRFNPFIVDNRDRY